MTTVSASSESSQGGGTRRVAVLGAGFAGLRAARELAAAGLDVSVFEARTAVGGRARGEWSGGHWMDGSWPVLGSRDAVLNDFARGLADRGVGDLFKPLRPVQTSLLRGGETIPVEGTQLRGAARIPGPKLWERGKLLRWPRLMARYAPLLDATHPERAASLDFRSVADHVSLYFGPGHLEFWLGPELHGTYGDAVDSLSRVALLQHIHAQGLGDARPALPGLPRRPLAELAQAASEGLALCCAAQIQRVAEQPEGGFSIEVRDAEGERTERDFDAVVLALGASEAARVSSAWLAPAERDFFAGVDERPVVTLAVALEGESSSLPQAIRLPRREDSAISALVLETGQEGGRAPQGASQLVLRAREAFARRWHETAGDVVSKNLLSSLELAMPGTGERVLATHLGRSPQAFFGVGHYRALANFQKVQRDRRSLGRRVYWAGDYLAGPTFEAAASSGLRAARALLADFRAEAGRIRD